MKRRAFLGCAIGTLATRPLFAMLDDQWNEADTVLTRAVASGQMRAAVIYVRDGNHFYQRAFGEAKSVDASFLLGSITKRNDASTDVASPNARW